MINSQSVKRNKKGLCELIERDLLSIMLSGGKMVQNIKMYKLYKMCWLLWKKMENYTYMYTLFFKKKQKEGKPKITSVCWDKEGG